MIYIKKDTYANSNTEKHKIKKTSHIGFFKVLFFQKKC